VPVAVPLVDVPVVPAVPEAVPDVVGVVLVGLVLVGLVPVAPAPVGEVPAVEVPLPLIDVWDPLPADAFTSTNSFPTPIPVPIVPPLPPPAVWR
jgi:hypothetical protein